MAVVAIKCPVGKEAYLRPGVKGSKGIWNTDIKYCKKIKKRLCMQVDETKNFLRCRKLDPKECSNKKGSYATITPKYQTDIRITICKKKDCVDKKGLAGCKTTTQSISYPLTRFKLDKKGDVIPQ
jgi:CRISPR/Cas system-associated exonuclease Cas4 (RecB family)